MSRFLRLVLHPPRKLYGIIAADVLIRGIQIKDLVISRIVYSRHVLIHLISHYINYQTTLWPGLY